MEDKNIPKLYGLVLAGGKSTRMGSDKNLIQYHGMPHQEYLYGLLNEVCNSVFLSIRPQQQASIPSHFKTIEDQNEYRGPFNGILSAHRLYPKAAWLVLACDLPLINSETIKQLAHRRNPNKLATSFATKKTKLPEPLITIWEPQGLERAKQYLETAESSCPRKFLINSDIELLYPDHDEVLYNANSISDYEYVKSKIS
ncbi:NTP transferase domain-containing protein [Muricauda sp. JGD-17]|uniref:Probable molybdenum cofactor guanylyltransferase n=1 Tax=Flagellimonas ochracea TaxID=2696472 RepID=A0A964WWV4_9FLAO|nr:NTP transferase domain-containing protein [Allomuricauda ochracea]NAY90954.1 NTP transferase domain-containing protein [Allomuricauda ochracea]